MSAYRSTTNSAGLDRIGIEDERGVGVMVFALDTPDSGYSKRYAVDTWEAAWELCSVEWGVPVNSWVRTGKTPNSN